VPRVPAFQAVTARAAVFKPQVPVLLKSLTQSWQNGQAKLQQQQQQPPPPPSN
jgi:hypothetical protein